MRGLSIFSPSSCSASSSLDLRLPIVIRRTAGAVSSACTLLHFTKKICSMYYTVCIHFTFPILDNTIIADQTKASLLGRLFSIIIELVLVLFI